MRSVVAGLLVLVAALAVAQPAMADDRTLERYAEGTWRSFVAMTDNRTGFPADALERDGTRSVQTSTTNIGAYMWSAVVAERLGIISRSELSARMRRTVATLETLERHEPSGQFYNWYDHRTGEKLTVWPPSGAPLTPILSSVDNGWLAVGLKIVANRLPELSRRADALYESMNFGFYYRPARNQMLFHYIPDTGAEACCYDTIISESRIAAYIGIAKGEVPERVHFGPYRSFPDTCDWSWTETRAGRLHAHLLRHVGLRRLAALRGHARDPELGRQHVRGADAGPVRARGALGAGQLGRQPPAHRRRTDPPRPGRGRLRLLGLLAVQPPRRAATTPTASTGSAATRTAIRRTTTAR